MSPSPLTPAAKIQVALTDQPIDERTYRDSLTNPDTGSQAWFHGVTRRRTGDRITRTLFYQAKHAMAVHELTRLAEEASQQFRLMAVVIVHRLGEVPIGQASIVLGCSSAHRADTFAALAWIMDEIKRDVPIWKQETFEDGKSEWIHPGAQS